MEQTNYTSPVCHHILLVVDVLAGQSFFKKQGAFSACRLGQLRHAFSTCCLDQLHCTFSACCLRWATVSLCLCLTPCHSNWLPPPSSCPCWDVAATAVCHSDLCFCSGAALLGTADCSLDHCFAWGYTMPVPCCCFRRCCSQPGELPPQVTTSNWRIGFFIYCIVPLHAGLTFATPDPWSLYILVIYWFCI